MTIITTKTGTLVRVNQWIIIIYSQDIVMDFGLEKCVMLKMKCRKRQIMEEIEIPNQERIRILGEKENYKYLRILELDIIKKEKMKEKIRKENLRWMRKLLKTNLWSRNLIKGINT